MKTAKVNTLSKNITFKTHSGMYTKYKSPLSGKAGQFGANIFTVDGDESKIVLVGVSSNGSELTGTTTVIDKEHYSRLCDLHDPHNEFEFHNGIMGAIGFK